MGVGSGGSGGTNRITATVKVTDEAAKEIWDRFKDGHLCGVDPTKGKFGNTSWFVSKGNPWIGGDIEAKATVELKEWINLKSNCLVIHSSEIERSVQKTLDEMSRDEAQWKAVYEGKNPKNIGSPDWLERFDKWKLARAKYFAWEEVANRVASHPSQQGRVILDNSLLSMRDKAYANGEFVVCANEADMQLTESAVEKLRMVSPTPGADRVPPSEEDAAKGFVNESLPDDLKGFKGGRSIRTLAVRGFRIRELGRAGGHVLFVVGVAADVYAVVTAHDKCKMFTMKVGAYSAAWALSAACASLAAIRWAPLNAADGVTEGGGTALYGVLIGGSGVVGWMVGYATGETVTSYIYDFIRIKDMKIVGPSGVRDVH